MKYDLIIERRGTDESPGKAVGYMCAWGESAESPVALSSEPPELQVSTSTGLTRAGGSFSARDAAPPYPIEVNNWQAGAGQKSYDGEDALDSAFYAARNIDVTQEGMFGLGPRSIIFPDTTIRNTVGFAMGTFWAGFTPATGDPRKQLRFLLRGDVVFGASYLIAPDSTVIYITNYSAIPDLSLSGTMAVAVNDYLYSPSTGEVIKVNSGSTGVYTVTRGVCGTTAVAHVSGEQWVLLRWQPVTFASPNPAEPLTAIASDGEYVYASFHTPGFDNGSVWRGTTAATNWTKFSDADNIVDLTICAGYLYGAQDKLANGTKTVAGYFTTAGVFTPLSQVGALTPRSSTAGLTSVGNFVYWGTTAGGNSSVFRIQHAAENLFELVSHLVPGFTLTSLLGHLGNLYAGGYIDTLATGAYDADLPQYEGALYLIGSDNVVARLFRVKDASDSRIKGLTPAGPLILCLANEDCYVYDTSKGGYSHYAQTPSNTLTGATALLDWYDGGFTTYEVDPVIGPLMIDSFRYGTGANDYVKPTNTTAEYPTGQNWISTDESGTTFYRTHGGFAGDNYEMWRVDAGKWRRVTIAAGTTPAGVITLPTTMGTIEWRADYFRSQGGTVVVGMDTKEVRVKMYGTLTPDGAEKNFYPYLGWTDDPDCALPDYAYIGAGTYNTQPHTLRLTFGGLGAKLYVDGVLAASVAYEKLRDAVLPNSIRYSVGYPGDPKGDTNREYIKWIDMRYTPQGEYPPSYVGGVLLTTEMKDIASAQGVSVVPAPGESWAYIDQGAQAADGSLETSSSGFHMGSVKKYFMKVSLEHTELREGQSLSAVPYVDGSPYGGGSGVLGSTLTEAFIGAQGRSIKVLLTIEDDDPSRPYSERLRVNRITSRFFPVNSSPQHVFYINCRRGVQCRDNKDWDFDPEDAIRHAFSAAESGEVVDVYSNFTEEGEHEYQEFRIEAVKLAMSPGDHQGGYDRLCGTLMLKMRRVDV